MSILILLILMFCFSSPLTAGEVYKTLENDGSVKYTNIKPDHRGEKVLETKSYSHPDTESPTAPESKTEPVYPDTDKEKQDSIDEVFRERAELLYEREQRLVEEIEQKEKYIYELDEVIEDYLVNGYFADRYIFELKVQKNNLEKLREELDGIDEQWYQLKKEARKNSVNPGVLRVR